MAAGDLTTLENVKGWIYGTNPSGFAATQKPITGITQAADGEVTCSAHGFAQAQMVMLSAIAGMTALNNETVTVTVVDQDHFTIGVNTSGFPAYGGGGVASAEDVVLARLISAVSAFVQRWCGRTFALADYNEIRNGTGGARLTLLNQPVVGVSALTIDDITVASSSGAPETGYLFNDREIALIGHCFRRGLQNVAISYQAGFTIIPLEIEQAVIELAAEKYQRRGRIGEIAHSAGGEETVSFSQKDMADDIKDMLEKYRLEVYG